jgi:outer membrane protein assembly factor BamB
MGRFGDPASKIAVFGKKIYVGNAEGELACVDPETGDSAWQARLPGAAYLMPVCRGERDIIAATTNGHVVRLQGERIVATTTLEGRIANGPALFGETLVVGTNCDLCYGLNATSLETKWRRSFESDIVAGPLVVGTIAVLITAERILYGLDGDSGAILWQHTLPSGISAPPLVGDQELCMPLDNGELHLFGLDGAPKAVGKTGGGPIGAMCRLGRTLFFGNDAGACIAFDLSKAAVSWSYAGPTPIEAAPCVLKGRVFFATIKGDFLVMEILP